MTAQNGEGVYGDGVGVVTPLAHKLSQNGPLVKDSTGKPRSGVFYAGNASLVSGKANMSYDVAAFEAAICRARTRGTSFPSNDAVVNVTTTAAPGSNSRIDIIYFQQKEVSEGDDATEAVVGVVQGAAASSPTAPTLPDGAIELARAVVGAGITATTSATITQTAPFTAPWGSVVPFRTTTEMNSWTPLADQEGRDLSSGVTYRFDGSAWRATARFETTATASQSMSGTGTTAIVKSAWNTTPTSIDSSCFTFSQPNGTLTVLKSGLYDILVGLVVTNAASVAYTAQVTKNESGGHVSSSGNTNVLDIDFGVTATAVPSRVKLEARAVQLVAGDVLRVVVAPGSAINVADSYGGRARGFFSAIYLGAG